MPLVRETDEAVQPSTYEMHESRARLDTKWQMSFAVTPSGDGQSLTRCILVIAVSCATRKPDLGKPAEVQSLLGMGGGWGKSA